MKRIIHWRPALVLLAPCAAAVVHAQGEGGPVERKSHTGCGAPHAERRAGSRRVTTCTAPAARTTASRSVRSLSSCPAGRGVIVDPPDGKLPVQPWAKAEADSRSLPERGYDDPTAHCFAAGVPRSLYVPSPFAFVQTPEYVVMVFERMSWRIIPLDRRPHLPDAHPPVAGRFGRPLGRRHARRRDRGTSTARPG